MQTYDYSETLFHYLTSSSREIDMGPVVRQYKLDHKQPEYYFFTKIAHSGDIVPPIPEHMVPLFHDVNRVKLVNNLSF